MGLQSRCEHQGRVPVLPGSHPPLSRFRYKGQACEHGVWSGAPRLYLYTSLCGVKVRSCGIDPKSCEGTGAGGNHGQCDLPGIIHTEMWDYNDRVWGKMLGDYGPGELMAEWVEGIPMGRAGTPAEVGALVCLPRLRRCRLHYGPDHQCGWRADHVVMRWP